MATAWLRNRRYLRMITLSLLAAFVWRMSQSAASSITAGKSDDVDSASSILRTRFLADASTMRIAHDLIWNETEGDDTSGLSSKSDRQQTTRKTGAQENFLCTTSCTVQTPASISNSSYNQLEHSLFPDDIFTPHQRRHGAVLLYAFGMVYMFVALAVVCDEYFVPSLDVITERLAISEDVAGATFMAAGGSAPELFTSIIGVFIAKNDVGTSTIVGSAAFNILFVIAMCSFFSRGLVALSGWPLFRDMVFYTISLLLLMWVFDDQNVEWWEAAVMFLFYVVYCVFMKLNERIHAWFNEKVVNLRVNRVTISDHLVPRVLHGAKSRQSQQANYNFRQGLLQLMLHSLDPLHRGVLDETATQLHTFASLRALIECENRRTSALVNGQAAAVSGPVATTNPTSTTATAVVQSATADDNIALPAERAVVVSDDAAIVEDLCAGGDQDRTRQDAADCEHSATAKPVQDVEVDATVHSDSKRCWYAHQHDLECSHIHNSNDCGGCARGLECAVSNDNCIPPQSLVGLTVSERDLSHSPCTLTTSLGSSRACSQARQLCAPVSDTASVAFQNADATNDNDDKTAESRNWRWPQTIGKQMGCVLVAPILCLLLITLPDCKSDKGRRLFLVTFVGSIVWISVFSYLMVWWAMLIASTIEIPSEVVGMTVLAAGTSIPDLITSVIVTRKGFGDMAISSSIGSNIFDICIGLPVPWLLRFAFDLATQLVWQQALPNRWTITIVTRGMICMILLLLCMLVLVTVSIAGARWRLSRSLALVMLALYVIFLVIALLLEFSVIECFF